jgi:DNA-binding SARP family transcriptional activator
MMRRLASSGEESAALAQYEICRQTLNRELDVEPDQETIALYRHIRAGSCPVFQAQLSAARVGRIRHFTKANWWTWRSTAYWRLMLIQPQLE